MNNTLRLVAAALILLAAACGGGESSRESAQPAPEPEAAAVNGSVQAEDQSSDGTSITVSSVEIEGSPGWIAVHSDVDGAPGPVVGIGQVEEGATSGLVIRLDQPLTASGALWPMLHLDDHTVGAYEFGQVEGADAPVKANGEIVMRKIQVTLP
jgi:hypothetical protein